jgi:formate dehydrogenase major subunit
MDITRRDFLKWSGAAGAGLVVASLGFDLGPIKAYAQANPPTWETEIASICPYCGCGCGVICCSDTNAENLIYIRGDPDHPINEGALCSKGVASVQMCTVDGAVNPQRMTQPLKRVGGASDWTAISWSTALSEIAGLIKNERDASSLVDNRLETIAALGTAKDTNEECYLYTKLMRALGIVYLEHCARV